MQLSAPANVNLAGDTHSSKAIPGAMEEANSLLKYNVPSCFSLKY